MKKHISWEYYPNNMGGFPGEEADKIIDDIMELLKGKGLTVKIVTQLLEDAKEAVWNEVLLTDYIGEK